MKSFTFTVDDNIRFLREMTEAPRESLFDHPYPALYKRLHDTYGLKIQLNLFYRDETFTLADMTNRYRAEWEACADWLKLSFHSERENKSPYENADYETVYRDISRVQSEILRFAGEGSLAKTTTVHYCLAPAEGLRALGDAGVIGLLGLYGTPDKPRSSYQNSAKTTAALREGKIVFENGIAYAAIDCIVNQFAKNELKEALSPLLGRDRIGIMIHEQYFYPDYHRYQADFAEKLAQVFSLLTENGYESVFFEDLFTHTA